ncbi:hypothetical protein [Haladaptatus halobius]|uniref:hypothetical protein n=1 Tax=Haladaptatus halobius TaxID=2884875 RepID=UPI001D0A3D9D|nr:hypothetical protein [Haladaptatus halobius]
MSENPETTGETRITTDRETIRTWADESGWQPAYRTDAETRSPFAYSPERHADVEVEEAEWEEFLETFDDEEMAVIRYPATDEEAERYEVVPRSEVAERATLENAEVEQALLDGETVRSEITETRIIEREIVETETIESEVVDSEIVADRIIDTELIRRELTDTEPEFVDDDTLVLEFDETRLVRREVVERKRIESEVVDVDVAERDVLEEDSLESVVDIEGVQRTLLQSDLFGEMPVNEAIEAGHIESEFTEGRIIESLLFERRLVEDEIVDRVENVYNLTESEVIESTTATSDLVESDIVDAEYVEREFGSEVVTGTTESTVVEETTETEMTEDETMETETTETETAEMEGATETESEAVSLNNRDTGKNVVNRDGEKIGMVAEVEGDTIYVDPNPSFTDRVKAELGIEEHDEDTYPVRADQIDEVTRTEVRIAG